MTPQQYRQMQLGVGATLIVIGAIIALTRPFLNYFPPEEIAQARVMFPVAGGFIVLIGISTLWIALGKQPKSSFLRGVRAFLFTDAQTAGRMIRDKKSKAILIWFFVTVVLTPVAFFAAFINNENNGSALVSIILIIIHGGSLLLAFALGVSLLVRRQRIARGDFDD